MTLHELRQRRAELGDKRASVHEKMKEIADRTEREDRQLRPHEVVGLVGVHIWHIGGELSSLDVTADAIGGDAGALRPTSFTPNGHLPSRCDGQGRS